MGKPITDIVPENCKRLFYLLSLGWRIKYFGGHKRSAVVPQKALKYDRETQWYWSLRLPGPTLMSGESHFTREVEKRQNLTEKQITREERC